MANKLKKVHDQILALTDKTPDKVLYDLLVLITGDDELKKISGIEKNIFVRQAKDYFFVKKNFSAKYRTGILSTLKVYAQNIVSARKL